MPTLRNPFDLCPRIPENLKQAIENVIAKSEEINYDPGNDTNWMNLPNEMKKEIVDRMDFLSRIRLGATAKDEKIWAEAKKYQLNGLQIYYSRDSASFRAYNIVGHRLLREEFVVKKQKPTREWLKKTTMEIFEKFEIQSFYHNSRNIHPGMSTDLFGQFAPLTFKRYVCGGDWEVNTFVLENCENLESISIDAFHLTMGTISSLFQLPTLFRRDYDFYRIFSIPSVRNAKHLELVNVFNLPGFHEIVQEWFNSDAEINKSMEVQIGEAGMINSFAEKFQDKIAEKTNERLRIRMEDQSKQILIQKIDNFDLNPHSVNFLIKVIPTGLPESEYKTVPFDKFKYSFPCYNIFAPYAVPELPA